MANMRTAGLQSALWLIYMTLLVGSLTQTGERWPEIFLQLHTDWIHKMISEAGHSVED